MAQTKPNRFPEWQIKLKRQLRRSCTILCVTGPKSPGAVNTRKFTVRNVGDVHAGTAIPVIIRAPTADVATAKAKAILRAEGLKRYDIHVMRTS